MTTFDQELTGRYFAAGGDPTHLDARRVARAVFVPDTIGRLCNADKKFGIDPADNGSLRRCWRRTPRAHRQRRSSRQ